MLAKSVYAGMLQAQECYKETKNTYYGELYGRPNLLFWLEQVLRLRNEGHKFPEIEETCLLLGLKEEDVCRMTTAVESASCM